MPEITYVPLVDDLISYLESEEALSESSKANLLGAANTAALLLRTQSGGQDDNPAIHKGVLELTVQIPSAAQMVIKALLSIVFRAEAERKEAIQDFAGLPADLLDSIRDAVFAGDDS